MFSQPKRKMELMELIGFFRTKIKILQETRKQKTKLNEEEPAPEPEKLYREPGPLHLDYSQPQNQIEDGVKGLRRFL